MIVGNTDNEDNIGNFQYPNPAAIYPGIPGVNGAPACERNSYAPEDEVFPITPFLSSLSFMNFKRLVVEMMDNILQN